MRKDARFDSDNNLSEQYGSRRLYNKIDVQKDFGGSRRRKISTLDIPKRVKSTSIKTKKVDRLAKKQKNKVALNQNKKQNDVSVSFANTKDNAISYSYKTNKNCSDCIRSQNYCCEPHGLRRLENIIYLISIVLAVFLTLFVQNYNKDKNTEKQENTTLQEYKNVQVIEKQEKLSEIKSEEKINAKPTTKSEQTINLTPIEKAQTVDTNKFASEANEHKNKDCQVLQQFNLIFLLESLPITFDKSQKNDADSENIKFDDIYVCGNINFVFPNVESFLFTENIVFDNSDYGNFGYGGRIVVPLGFDIPPSQNKVNFGSNFSFSGSSASSSSSSNGSNFIHPPSPYGFTILTLAAAIHSSMRQR